MGTGLMNGGIGVEQTLPRRECCLCFFWFLVGGFLCVLVSLCWNVPFR